MSWTSPAAALPTDVNALAVDAEASTRGNLFLSGGGTENADKAIRVFDIETASLARAPMLGHQNYIHDIDFCSNNGSVVSASEDGTARLWDPRSKSGQVHAIHPSQHSSLQRSKVGKWIGAVSLSGDWLAVGGGPR